MTLKWQHVIVHSADPAALGQWWAEALGWVVAHTSDAEFAIRPEPDRLPGLEFVRLDEPKKATGPPKPNTRPADLHAPPSCLLKAGGGGSVEPDVLGPCPGPAKAPS
jgi:hypothetical protein